MMLTHSLHSSDVTRLAVHVSPHITPSSHSGKYAFVSRQSGSRASFRETRFAFPSSSSTSSSNSSSRNVRIGVIAKSGSSGANFGDAMDAKGPLNADEASGMGASDPQRHIRRVDLSERLMADPYRPVESAMTTPVVTTTPSATISSVLNQFVHFTGLPVVDNEGHCIGVISNIDIAKHQRRSFKSVSDARVREVMTSPAIVIVRHAPVAYAAGLMLKHKIHRLPVVDSCNVVIGILTRTDIYEPLMPHDNPVFHRVVGMDGNTKV